ncbi:hypothetical protein [Streptomyces sp. DB-54]
MPRIDAPAIAQLAAAAHGPLTALRFKRAGAWHTLSYRQLTKVADAFASPRTPYWPEQGRRWRSVSGAPAPRHRCCIKPLARLATRG